MTTLFAPPLPRRIGRATVEHLHPPTTQLGMFAPQLGARISYAVRRGLLDALLLLAVLTFTALALGPRTGEYRTVTMLTGSMRPAFPAGSLLVITPEPAAAVEVGQVVTFNAPTPDHRVVTHRVEEVVQRTPLVLKTKGDANAESDPWLARVDSDTVWQVRAVVPAAGRLVVFLRTREAHLLLLYAAPAVLAMWFLVGLWRPHPEP